jgi:hypothetical protein
VKEENKMESGERKETENGCEKGQRNTSRAK